MANNPKPSKKFEKLSKSLEVENQETYPLPSLKIGVEEEVENRIESVSETRVDLWKYLDVFFTSFSDTLGKYIAGAIVVGVSAALYALWRAVHSLVGK